MSKFCRESLNMSLGPRPGFLGNRRMSQVCNLCTRRILDFSLTNASKFEVRMKRFSSGFPSSFEDLRYLFDIH